MISNCHLIFIDCAYLQDPEDFSFLQVLVVGNPVCHNLHSLV